MQKKINSPKSFTEPSLNKERIVLWITYWNWYIICIFYHDIIILNPSFNYHVYGHGNSQSQKLQSVTDKVLSCHGLFIRNHPCQSIIARDLFGRINALISPSSRAQGYNLDWLCLVRSNREWSSLNWLGQDIFLLHHVPSQPNFSFFDMFYLYSYKS